MVEPESKGSVAARPWRSRDVYRWIVAGFGAYALAGGFVSFLGWAAGIPRLTDWEGNGISIQPNTTVVAMASGAALLLLARGWRRAAAALGALVGLMGASTLFQWIAGVNFDVLNTLFLFGREWGRRGLVQPGRMGPPGSTCWTLLGVALLLASTRRGSRARGATPVLAMLALSIATFSIIGYLYASGPLYSLPYLTVISLQTATLVVAVSAGAIAAVPEHPPMRWLLHPGATGMVARRSLPFLVVVPPLVGGLALAGELSGLYDARFEIAIMVLTLMGLLVALLASSLATIARHERRLRQSERRVVDTLESITDAFATVDRDWRCIVVNEQAAKLVGKNRADLLGRSVWEVFPESLGGAAYQQLHRAAAERVSVEYEDFNPVLGRWFAGRAYPTHDGGIAVYFQDITERKRVEQQLEVDFAAMTRLQALSTQLVHAGDLTSLLREILSASADLTGTDKGNIQLYDPQSQRLRIVVHQGLGPRFVEHFAENGWDATCGAAAQKKERVLLEDVAREPGLEGSVGLEVVLEDGIRAMQSTPLIRRDGFLLGMLSNHFRTPHRPSDGELRYLDLLARMAADFIERSQAEQDQRDADRRKNEFLAMLAHELRNPLAPMRSAVEILRLARGDAGVVRTAAEMMERQVTQMVRLVDDLLDVSRITRGRIELRKERVELSTVVKQAVEATRSMLDSMGHELELELPLQPIDLCADPARLIQVIGNLLHNACKFTHEGGRIALTLERHGEQAVLRVRDSGIGIAADQLPHIFDMFVQVDTSLERSAGGLGIGLTLVKSLVEMHGGEVEVRSEGLGHGCEFAVWIPIGIEEASLRRAMAASD